MATKTRKSKKSTPKKVPSSTKVTAPATPHRRSTDAPAAPLPTDNITHRRIGDVRADVRTYTRCTTAAGNMSLHNGDPVARKLAGKGLDDVYKLAADATGLALNALKARYTHLNPGMQRMNLGNLIRGAL